MSKNKNRSGQQEEVDIFERRKKATQLVAWVAILGVLITTAVTFGVSSIAQTL